MRGAWVPLAWGAVHFVKRDMTALFGARRVLRFKIHLADAAIAPAVLLEGKAFLDNAAVLGVATETAVFKHLFARHYPHNVRFSYWRGRKDHEVDLVAEPEGSLVPFEVKYRAQLTGVRELKGLVELCETKRITRGYVATKSAADLGPLPGLGKATDTGGKPIPQIMRVPAPLLCFWMGATEHLENSART